MITLISTSTSDLTNEYLINRIKRRYKSVSVIQLKRQSKSLYLKKYSEALITDSLVGLIISSDEEIIKTFVEKINAIVIPDNITAQPRISPELRELFSTIEEQRTFVHTSWNEYLTNEFPKVKDIKMGQTKVVQFNPTQYMTLKYEPTRILTLTTWENNTPIDSVDITRLRTCIRFKNTNTTSLAILNKMKTNHQLFKELI